VRWVHSAIVLLFLTGCQMERKDEESTVTVTENRTVSVTTRSPTFTLGFGKASGQNQQPASAKSSNGTIIDQANALEPKDMQALAEEFAKHEEAGGPRMTLIMVRPTARESIEQLSWAVAGQPGQNGVTLLVDVDKAVVRIEGPFPPERKAAVASAMRADLVAKRYPEAARAALAAVGS
jgi:hypothetical protein